MQPVTTSRAPGPATSASVEDGVDRLLAGRLDEGAGVDHHEIGRLRGLGAAVPLGSQTALQLVGVDLVLRAPQGLQPVEAHAVPHSLHQAECRLGDGTRQARRGGPTIRIVRHHVPDLQGESLSHLANPPLSIQSLCDRFLQTHPRLILPGQTAAHNRWPEGGGRTALTERGRPRRRRLGGNITGVAGGEMTGRPIGKIGKNAAWNRPRKVGALLTVLTVLLGSLAGLTAAVSGGAAVGATLGGCSPPTITSAGSATVTAGVPFSFTVTTCATAVPVIKATGLPVGLLLTNNQDGTATIAGTPRITDNGIYNARITASVMGLAAAVQTYVVTVDNAPQFHSKAVYTAHTGTSFVYAITTRYGYPLPTISTSSGLPAGVSLTNTGNGGASLGGIPGPNAGGVYHLSLPRPVGPCPPSKPSP